MRGGGRDCLEGGEGVGERWFGVWFGRGLGGRGTDKPSDALMVRGVVGRW